VYESRYVKTKETLMRKVIKHDDVEYNVDKLIAIKSQGVTLQTDNINCKIDGSVVIEDISKPIAIKDGNGLLILIDTLKRDQIKFEVVLLSKHILKKARTDLPEIDLQSSQFNSGYRAPGINQTYRRPNHQFQDRNW
jgi:hypothetical protein